MIISQHWRPGIGRCWDPRDVLDHCIAACSRIRGINMNSLVVRSDWTTWMAASRSWRSIRWDMQSWPRRTDPREWSQGSLIWDCCSHVRRDYISARDIHILHGATPKEAKRIPCLRTDAHPGLSSAPARCISQSPWKLQRHSGSFVKKIDEQETDFIYMAAAKIIGPLTTACFYCLTLVPWHKCQHMYYMQPHASPLVHVRRSIYRMAQNDLNIIFDNDACCVY